MIEFSKEQKRAIDLRDRDILVAASAGSGKTTVMIERIAALLEEGNRIDRMLVVTFTRAAAADMKEKLAHKLLASKGAARQAVYSLPEADISTLHSWCQKIAQEYFYAIGISPESEVMEEGESDLILQRSIDLALGIEAEEAAEDFAKFCAVFGDSRDDKGMKRLIRRAFRLAAVRVDCGYEYLNEDECRRELLADLLERRERLAARIDMLIDDTEANCFKRNIEATKELYSFLFGGERPRRLYGKVAAEFATLNERYKSLRDAADALRKESDELESAKDGSNQHLMVLERLVKKTSEIYGQIKGAQGKLDFNDLERAAVKLLKSAGQEIRQKYDFIFVDEYQDINPLQNQIISLLRRDDCSNRFFFVGDLKQSIYAFRGCDPSIFASLAREFAERGDAEVIRLNANHRSQRGILSFANEVFSGVMTEEFGGSDYLRDGKFILREESVEREVACAQEPERREVYIHLSECENAVAEGIYDIAAHEPPPLRQADEAASCIVDILKNYTLTEGGQARPVLFRDIAVLVRGACEAALSLQAALKALGIRTSLSPKLRREATGESALIWYLRLIDNGLDDEALVNSMLGFFGGFGENEMLSIRRASPREEYYHECAGKYLETGEDAGIKTKLQAFFDKTKRYRDLAAQITPAELAGLIVSESGYFNRAFAVGRYEAEALDAFLHSAEEREAASLTELLEWESEKQAEPPAGATDAVRIMTAHGSKGLEFPFVLILDAQKRFNLKDLNEPVLVNQNRAAIKNYDFGTLTVTPSPAWLYLRRENLRLALEEELRLLYVAITRAKYRLDIFASVGESSDEYDADFDDDEDSSAKQEARSWLDWLMPFAAPYLAAPYPLVDAQSFTAVWPKAPHGLIQRLEEQFAFKTKSCLAPCKTYVTALVDSLTDSDEAQGVAYHSAAKNDDRAMELGTLYHRAMELADFSFECDFDSWWASLDGEISDKVKRDDIWIAVNSVGRLTRGKTHFREQPFMLRLKAFEAGMDGDAEILVQGVIDLLIIEGNECTVLDYKTGNIYPSARAQLDLYALACERILGVKVTGKLIYSFKEGKLLSLA